MLIRIVCKYIGADTIYVANDCVQCNIIYYENQNMISKV